MRLIIWLVVWLIICLDQYLKEIFYAEMCKLTLKEIMEIWQIDEAQRSDGSGVLEPTFIESLSVGESK